MPSEIINATLARNGFLPAVATWVECHYKSEISVKIDSGSNPWYLALTVEDVNGDGEITKMDILPWKSRSFVPMQRSWGETWKFGIGNGEMGPYSIRLTNSASKSVIAYQVLLIGDSGVGKSSLLLSFISNCQHFPHDLSPTIGVDFKIKLLTTAGKRLKLTIWDTAGQERFGSLISSYYRGAHGIILVYDVTRRDSFTSLSKTWVKELERCCPDSDCIRILIGNKVDRENERAVTTEEGMALAKEHKCLFFECSAKTQANVKQCFKELTVKILEVPSLLEKGSTPVKNQILKQKQVSEAHHHDNCCS
ncbi:RAB GTPase-like protein C2A [Perilla frutescens var. hirtella]|nr:RAB GTPase-like protein C2A [Perilla frutescens var. hirtella]